MLYSGSSIAGVVGSLNHPAAMIAMPKTFHGMGSELFAVYHRKSCFMT